MIKAIRLKNFQSHPDTRLVLDPGVNVIVGASDSGKTAILRALNWAVTNRPLGDAFRSHWGGDVGVQVTLTDGGNVERGQDKKGGYYLAGRTDVADLELRALKGEVPDPVADAFNLSSLNLQGQHDAPFLLSESSGEVARQLNRVVRLDVIDTALAAAAGRVRDVNRSLKDGEALTSRLEGEIQGLAWIEDVDAEIGLVEALEAERLTVAGLLAGLKQVTTALVSAHHELDTAIRVLLLAPAVKALEASLADCRQARVSTHNIRALMSDANRAQGQIDGARKILGQVEAVNVLVVSLEKAEEHWDKAQALKRVLRDAMAAEKDRASAAASANALSVEFTNLMPDTCPLCGAAQ